jgi:osmotically-inducible protein OsmY
MANDQKEFRMNRHTAGDLYSAAAVNVVQALAPIAAIVLFVTGCSGTHTLMAQRSVELPQRDTSRDAAISQQVRRSIVNDPSMSIEAHNLYIHTDAGVLTLRGAIGSEAERDSILQLASQSGAQINNAISVIPDAVASKFLADPVETATKNGAAIQ